MSIPSLPAGGGGPVGLAVWPLVNGNLAVVIAHETGNEHHTLRYPHSHIMDQTPYMTGQILNLLPPKPAYLGVEGALRSPILARHIEAQGGQWETRLEDRRRARQLSRRALRQLPPERMRYARCRRRRVPPDFGGYVVATDASVAPYGAAWAYVTGGGWYATGVADTTSVPLVEWIAVCEALGCYPDQSRLTVLTDNQPVARIMADLAAGRRPNLPTWLTAQAYECARQEIQRLNVCAEWIPRATHALNSMADELCGHVSRGLAYPSATSLQSRKSRAAYGAQ